MRCPHCGSEVMDIDKPDLNLTQGEPSDSWKTNLRKQLEEVFRNAGFDPNHPSFMDTVVKALMCPEELSEMSKAYDCTPGLDKN